jgi:hypothetical protein
MYCTSNLSVFRSNEIGKGFRLFVSVVCIMAMTMVVSMGILLRTDVIHLEDVATLWAAFDGAITGHLCIFFVRI